MSMPPERPGIKQSDDKSASAVNRHRRRSVCRFGWRIGRSGGTGKLVLYVAAADCRVCRGWEVDHKAAFVQGLQRHGIGFRQITVTSLRNVRDDAAWTPELAWIRDNYPNMRGTPWFFLV